MVSNLIDKALEYLQSVKPEEKLVEEIIIPLFEAKGFPAYKTHGPAEIGHKSDIMITFNNGLNTRGFYS